MSIPNVVLSKRETRNQELKIPFSNSNFRLELFSFSNSNSHLERIFNREQGRVFSLFKHSNILTFKHFLLPLTANS
jgi:hypothetical protein